MNLYIVLNIRPAMDAFASSDQERTLTAVFLTTFLTLPARDTGCKKIFEKISQNSGLDRLSWDDPPQRHFAFAHDAIPVSGHILQQLLDPGGPADDQAV